MPADTDSPLRRTAEFHVAGKRQKLRVAAEGPVTVSPFRRNDSSPETLWLWVMLTPSDGPVHLVATWPLRVIDRATVEFHVAGSR